MTILDAELIKLLTYFEQKTSARVKDCFYDSNGKLTFIIESGDIGKAIGKQAKNLKELESKLNKKIRIAEYADDRQQFIQNLVMPLKVKNIEVMTDDVVVLHGGDEKTNGLLIGKKARNLRNLEWMVRKYFEVPEIKVI